jgi:hypothetical protein
MIIQIKYKKYKVKVYKMTVKQAKLHNAYGIYNNSRIFIQENLSNKNFIDTLFHEIAHFIIDKTKNPPKSEEAAAYFVGTEFSRIFFQNPSFIDFIKKYIKDKNKKWKL